MGKDVLSPAQAWEVYDEWRADDRVVFLSEHIGLSELWRRFGEQISAGPNYLAAFAAHAKAMIVTLDRKFLRLGDVRVKILP